MLISGLRKRILGLRGLGAAALLLANTGCTGLSRTETANHFTAPAHMIEEKIPADPFLLTSYERILQPGGVADVYIEGDGLAWLGRTTKSLDPTPTNPIALALAAQDPSNNVIYLARPCQYSKLIDPTKSCSNDYWTERRFSPDVIASMNMALDYLKTKFGLNGFHLIGYSGGGAVATLLAARRNDILSLRTVAGNLDHETVNNDHHVSPLIGSLNARDVAAKLATIPQHHFLGAQDQVVTPDVYQSFRKAMGESHCIRMSLVPEANHEQGWTEHWPSLLQQPVDCAASE